MPTKINPTKKIVEFLFEIGSMRKIIRAHRQSLLTDDMSDNIASHSFRVAWIGWILSKMEEADSGKVMVMCLAHDTSEARSGDQNWVHKRYVKVFEDEIIKDQITGLPGENNLKDILNEYHERKTKESKIAKDADRIDQLLLIKEYVMAGNLEAKNWGSEHYKSLYTVSAKKIVRELKKKKPSDWWSGIWTEKRR